MMIPREATSSIPRPAVRPFRWLSWTLAAGAAYDFFFAVLFVVAPDSLERQFALPLPGERFYLRLIAVLLAIAAGCYAVAARDPSRYRAVVAVAIAGRALGGLVLGIEAAARPDLAGLWPVAIGDAAWAVLHAATSRGLWRGSRQ